MSSLIDSFSGYLRKRETWLLCFYALIASTASRTAKYDDC